MPIVTISHAPSIPTDDLVAWGKDLTVIVAEELHLTTTANGYLRPEGVTVKFVPHGSNDINTFPIEVRIEAQHLPDRAANKKLRCQRIRDRARNCETRPNLPDDESHKAFFFWLVLVEGAFEFF